MSKTDFNWTKSYTISLVLVVLIIALRLLFPYSKLNPFVLGGLAISVGFFILAHFKEMKSADLIITNTICVILIFGYVLHIGFGWFCI